MAAPTSFPSFVYHETEPSVLVQTPEAFEALGEGWSGTPFAPPVVPPVVTALDPPAVMLGQPSFTIRVLGEGFSPDAVIVWNGSDEPTTVVSAAELTTGVNMTTAEAVMTLPVCVRNGDGTLSNELSFEFLAAQTRASRRPKE